MRTILLSLAIAAGLFAADVNPQVPRKAPEFVLNLPDGTQKLLSSYRGKVIVVQCLFTTCPHCAHASQILSKLNTEFGPKGVQIVGIAFDEMAKLMVPDYIKNNKVNFPVAYSAREPMMVLLGLPPDARLSVPQMIFIDKKGMIRQQSQPVYDEKTATEENMRKMMETLSAEAGGSQVSSKRAAARK